MRPDEFRNTFGRYEVHRSAFKHGVSLEDTLHAAAHALVAYPIEDDPPRRLLLGPGRSGRLLVLRLGDGRDLVIHSMPMRPKYRPLLTGCDE